jgi:protein phosphatase
VVYGHTPHAQARWINNTINIDTGCVFGGGLTALRWPEKELVYVPAKHTYSEARRPFKTVEESEIPLASPYDLLLSDVYPAEEVSSGNRRVQTTLLGNVLIERANSAAALEIITRFGVDPRWMVYLPPTMSPCETERSGPYLEHPNGAFEYFRKYGIKSLVCQEKHMGSRAVIVICKDNDVLALHHKLK